MWFFMVIMDTSCRWPVLYIVRLRSINHRALHNTVCGEKKRAFLRKCVKKAFANDGNDRRMWLWFCDVMEV